MPPDVIGFATRVPGVVGGTVEISIIPMELPHVELWEDEIQPAIREMDRADNTWKWRQMATPIITSNTTVNGLIPAALSLGVRTTERFVPCGLLLLIKRVPYLLDNRYRSVYVWYLTSAPKSVLNARTLLSPAQTPTLVGPLLLDAAICASKNAGSKGRVGLHAAPEGGAKLLKFYSDEGLQAVPLDRKTPKALTSLDEPENDGRFFVHETTTADIAQARYNSWR